MDRRGVKSTTRNAQGHLDAARRWLRPSAGAAAVGVLTLLCGAGPPCGYEISAVIQAPPCPPPFNDPPATIATAISDGQHVKVAGYYYHCPGTTGGEAFIWSGGTLVTLDLPSGVTSAAAADIDQAGRVVGSYVVTGIGARAFLYDGGLFTELGVLPGGMISGARALNQAGQVVGWSHNPVTGPMQPFLWEAGSMTVLEVPIGPNGSANDINALGDVVGWMGDSVVQNAYAVLWRNGNGATELPAPIGALTSVAEAINNGGEVAGWGLVPESGFPFGVTRAFLWNDGNVINLGTLPGFDRSGAVHINEAGQAVGRSWGLEGNPNVSHAFLWDDGMMLDLNDLIAVNLGLVVTWANAINDQGQITGQAQDSGGHIVAVVLSPIPPPPGDINDDGAVDHLDLIELLACFGQPAAGGCTPADLNGDAFVNVLDLIALLMSYGAACRE